MALISCPECGKQISETTPACPHCGYQLSTESTAPIPKSTEIGPAKINIPGGLALILLGVVGIIGGIFLVFMFIGIFAIIGGVALIGLGFSMIKGQEPVTCPYCGKSTAILKDAETLKCPSCKKHSVRHGQHLDPVP